MKPALKMFRAPVWLASLIAALFFFGPACKPSGEAKGPGQAAAKRRPPVVIVGIDGLAWEMIRPLMEGQDYPLIKWADPVPVKPEELGYSRSGGLDGEQGVAAKDGVIGIDAAARNDVWGVTFTLPLELRTNQRRRIQLEARSLAGPLKLGTLAVYNREPDLTLEQAGENLAASRETAIGADWTKASLELQAPTIADSVRIVIIALPPDLKPGTDAVPEAARAKIKFELRSISVQAGEVLGAPTLDELKAMDPAKNRLPILTSLMRRGSYGYLKTLSPALSPLVWTTIATGRHPDQHGIRDFETRVEGDKTKTVLPTSSLRKVPALWNIVSAYEDRYVGVVNWWATWPAESVRGFIVSDHANEFGLRMVRDKGLAVVPGAEAAAGPGLIYPPELLLRIQDKFLNPKDLTREDLAMFVPAIDDELWRRFATADRIDEREPLSFIKNYYALDVSTFLVGMNLFRERAPDLFMIYLNGVDGVEHLFWKYQDPAIFSPAPTEAEVKNLGKAISGYYEFMDKLLGQMLEDFGDQATVLVVSDHGHYPVDFMRERPFGPSGGHRWRCPGVIVASGPGLRPERRLEDASVFQIAPTTLYLMNYPLEPDLARAILLDAIDPELAARQPIKTVERYNLKSPADQAAAPKTSEFDDEIRRKLKALGYIK